ncbi:MAG: ATP-binding protein [Armatimonadota bacterium]|nr:ATP-binding protein [Armatimonadota bacterium]
MRCVKCREPAVLEIRRHNAAFCAPHFLDFFTSQVERAIQEMRMFDKTDRILVAVSGGKDSLSLWDVLLRLGYQASGLYIHLGIGEYSERSKEKVLLFARKHEADLLIVDLPAEYGMNVEEMAKRSHRVPCSACGLSKRYLFNKVALDHGFDVVATAHNLDDEAAVLLGNLIHWQVEFLARQSPVLESTHPKLVKKVKPLYRLSERETAAYAVLRGIDYIVEECPNSVGARSLLYKEALNFLEAKAPGTKQSLYWGFLEQRKVIAGSILSPAGDGNKASLRECIHCGQPTTAEICAFCRMTEKAMEKMRTIRVGPAKLGSRQE